MSLLLDIAQRADVSLEGVVRVLTREPVSEDVKARVLAVIDHLDADQTRVLQRFALAAVHDVLPRTADEDFLAEFEEGPLELPEAVRFELAPPARDELALRVDDAPAAAPQDAPPAAAFDPAPLVQLGAVLGELSEAVRELRHETDAERRERVDDLAVLIDLITKGWQGVDRRLGRLERQVGRLEPGAAAAAAAPAALEPPPPPPVPPPDPPPPPDAADDDGRSSLRRRLPLIAALALGIALGVLAALDLPTRFDASAVVAETDGAAEVEPTSATLSPAKRPPVRTAIPSARPTSTSTSTSATAAKPKPAAPKRQAPTAPAAAKSTTAQAASTQATTTRAESQEPDDTPGRAGRPARPPATTAATEPAPTASTAPATTVVERPTPATGPAFTPSRNWAWPPVDGADYYFVEFFRGGQPLYSARPSEPRLTLPERIEFVPGFYRWRVRAGRGEPAANRLDSPIVDSSFEVQP